VTAKAAKEIAKKEGKTAGAVISELARRGFYRGDIAVAEGSVSYSLQKGVPVLAPTGSPVTEETIRQIRDSEGI
jgi:hypothetical protein